MDWDEGAGEHWATLQTMEKDTNDGTIALVCAKIPLVFVKPKFTQHLAELSSDFSVVLIEIADFERKCLNVEIELLQKVFKIEAYNFKPGIESFSVNDLWFDTI